MSTITAQEAGASMPTPPFPKENLVRAVPPSIEFRSDKNGGRTLSGHFSVFNQPYEVNSSWEGNFMETVAPGAFKKTFRENGSNIKVLYDHGHDPSVGNKPLGQISTLREDDTGAFYEVDLLDTSYVRDLLPGLERGLYGASFRFRVVREDLDEEPDPSESNPRGIPERTIKEVQVMEFGPVTFPASPHATAGVRSMTDEFIMCRFLEQPDRLRALLTNFLPAAAVEGDEKDHAPTDHRAEPKAHPVVVRRDTRPLYGLSTKEKPEWQL